MTFFSIIIPVRSINDYLRENISKLKQLDYPSFEVLIITDSKENYPLNDSRFRIISSGPVGPGQKRNLGVKNSIGGIIAFLDDDAYPEKNWLRKAKRIFEDPTVYALGGPALTPTDCGFMERVSGRLLETYITGGHTTYRHKLSSRRPVKDHPSVNLFIRREAFYRIRGFPTDSWPGEDTMICQLLVEEYERPFLYDPAPVVYHHRREGLTKHLEQVSRFGQHRGKFARLYKGTSRILYYFVPSLFLLGLILGPILSYFIPILQPVYFSVLALYLVLVFLESLRTAIRDRSLKMFLYMYVGIFLTQIVYGAFFIWGFLATPGSKLRSIDAKSGNYIGG